jgi:heme/copper-type cytochrome/quinol oxidase subunit 2
VPSSLFQWEWLLIELIVLGLAFWELYALRRHRRRKERERPPE